MLKAVIFDLDGTLVNAFPAVTRSINHVMDTFDLPHRAHQEIKCAVGWGEGDLMERFVGLERKVRALKVYRSHHKLALCNGGVKFLPGARSVLQFVKRQGWKLAIASNRPTLYTRIICNELGILKDFDAIVCADRVERAKPYPDMLNVLLKKFNVKPLEAVYVGDMAIDAQAAKRARMASICVTTGVHSAEEIQAVGCDYIIQHLKELKSILVNK